MNENNINVITDNTELYLLKKIDEIREDSMQLLEVIRRIEELEGDMAEGITAVKITSITSIVRDREETNHRLLKFYEKAYDDLHNAETRRLENLSNLFKPMFDSIGSSVMSGEEMTCTFSYITDKIAALTEKILFEANNEE